MSTRFSDHWSILSSNEVPDFYPGESKMGEATMTVTNVSGTVNKVIPRLPMSAQSLQARDPLVYYVTFVFSPVISPCDQASRYKFPHPGVPPRSDTVEQCCWLTLYRFSAPCNDLHQWYCPLDVGLSVLLRTTESQRRCRVYYYISTHVRQVHIFYDIRFRVWTFKKKSNTMLTMRLCVVVIIEIQTAFRCPSPRRGDPEYTTVFYLRWREDMGRTNESSTLHVSAFEYDNNGCCVTK